MSDNNQIIEEPWNDETNMSLDERRGTFLKVLCILSWVWIGIQLITNLFSYLGGPEKVVEAKSITEDSLSELDDSPFMRSVVEQSLEILDKTIENFNAIYLGNIVGLLIGGLAVYMMFMLKKTGFFLYCVYVGVILFVTVNYLGFSSAMLDMVISIAFIIMYAVNLKRMTA